MYEVLNSPDEHLIKRQLLILPKLLTLERLGDAEREVEDLGRRLQISEEELA